MIHWLIEVSVRYRFLVVLAAGCSALAGLYAAAHSPIDAVPDLSENQVIVFSNWPGHGPREIDQQITSPLSLQIQGLDGVRVVRGSSDIGYSMLHIIFEDHVTFAIARQRVQERLTSLEAQLPMGVIPRLAADGIPTGQIFWYTVEGAGYDLAQLRGVQDWTIAPQLRSVAGVAEVASVGGFVSELVVQVEPVLLAEHDLTIEDLTTELSRTVTGVGGHVLHKGNAEFVVQFQLPEKTDRVEEWEQRRIPMSNHRSVRLGDVARIAWGPAPRRGLFEKDGSEAVAGIVHLRYGHNPLEVTARVRTKLREVANSLPTGLRIIPCYDRTPLIVGAVETVTRALVEALVIAAVCVLLVLRHVRAWLVIALTLPLSVLGTFCGLSLLRTLGWVDIQTNIMSLAGIVISIGVLVDSSIVMTENVMHRLRQRFGDQPVHGDVNDTVVAACQIVGWPVFCSILVMLVSFAPVFALGGIDGRMYRPLAWTKSLALLSAALLAVTLVPALCALLVRGRIRDESESAVVRNVVSVYRPMLSWLIDRPQPLVFLLCATVVLAAIPLGSDFVFRGVLFGSLTYLIFQSISAREIWIGVGKSAVLIVIALIGQQQMRPIGVEMRLPLDEGMVMDMPITIPRASITQSGDDLKARNMLLCRFPEVSMVTGKAGRAETPFDPAPLDMIESMIEFRPRQFWPRRRLLHKVAERFTDRYLQSMNDAKLMDSVTGEMKREIIEATMFRFDAMQRETAWQLTEVFQHQLQQDLNRYLIEQIGHELLSVRRTLRELGNAEVAAVLNGLPAAEMRELVLSPSEESVSRLWPYVLKELDHQALLRETLPASGSTGVGSVDELPPISRRLWQGIGESYDQISELFGVARSTAESRVMHSVKRLHLNRWLAHLSELNRTLHQRTVATWLRLVSEECFSRVKIFDKKLAEVQAQILLSRNTPAKLHDPTEHQGLASFSELPLIDPHQVYDGIRRRIVREFASSFLLWSHDTNSLGGFGGEMDRTLQMPGWTNVWTRPIQNRVDMLATGVNAEVGVRVLGHDLEAVVRASEQIAAVLREVPGAADVVADPIRGKGVIQIIPDPVRASALGVNLTELQTVLETALSGRVLAHLAGDRQHSSVRLRIASAAAEQDEQSIRGLRIPCRVEHFGKPSSQTGDMESSGTQTVPLDAIATVVVSEGPATIKSENGWLRNYVRLNVRERNPLEFVAQAKQVVAKRVELPAGLFVEWTGQFEHTEQTRRHLLVLIPLVLLVILAMLYLTYRDWTDAVLMMFSVPGALAGGVLCQWLLGYKFSVSVGVGYIACFGMAAATGIVMLVYLREAVDLAGGLKNVTLAELKQAILNGAVHRLRPKLLTEATTILGLAPMLWSDGIGAEVIRPMAAPVLGGILIADEVIDLLLPVLFYHVRKRRWLQLHGMAAKTPPSNAANEVATETHDPSSIATGTMHETQ